MTRPRRAAAAPTPAPAPVRETGFYWLKDRSRWEPYGFWTGEHWSFPWSAAKYTDAEVGEIGPICRPPEGIDRAG